MSVALAARIRALGAVGKSVTAIAIETGAAPRTVKAVLDRKASPFEIAEQDRLSGWAPLCMDLDAWSHWRRTNPRSTTAADYAPRPCTDCPIGFAAEQRALGRCNGTPGWRPPADDIEEAEVGDTVTTANVQISAPCGSCAHAEVCSIKRTLGDLDEVEVSMPKPDPALTVVVAMTVECSHYLRGKGSSDGSKAGRRPFSAETRQKMRDARLATIERQRAAQLA